MPAPPIEDIDIVNQSPVWTTYTNNEVGFQYADFSNYRFNTQSWGSLVYMNVTQIQCNVGYASEYNLPVASSFSNESNYADTASEV